MLRLLLPLVLIVVPLAEIALFIQVGGRIGLLATVAAVVLTAVIGATMLRVQGFGILRQAQASLDAGRLPVGAVIDGIALFAAGLLLLTPGFLTDAIGFLLMVPPFRRWLAARVWRRLAQAENITVHTGFRADSGADSGAGSAGPVIEADYTEIDTGEAADARGDGEEADTSPWHGGRGRG